MTENTEGKIEEAPQVVDAPIVDSPAPVETPKEPVEPKNEREKVNNAVSKAIEQLKGKEEKPKVERAPDGKFAPKDSAKAVENTAPDNQTKVSADQPHAVEGKPPVGWAAEAKTEWSKLPPAIQNAVLKRESDFAKGYDQKSEQVRRYESALTPINQVAQQVGANPEYVINELVAAHHALNKNAPRAIMELAKKFNVDLNQLVSNPPATHAEVDPAYTNRLQTLEQQLQSLHQERITSNVDAFAKENPHFEAVSEQLQEIIPQIKMAYPNMSPAMILQKAYEQAIWLNPDVRTKLIGEQTSPSSQDAVKAKSVQAAKAAVSVKGSSSSASVAKERVPTKNAHEAARLAFQQLRGEQRA